MSPFKFSFKSEPIWMLLLGIAPGVLVLIALLVMMIFK